MFVGDSGTIDSLNTKKLMEEFDLPFTKDTVYYKFSFPMTKYFFDKEQNMFIGCIDDYDYWNTAFFELTMKDGVINKKKYFEYGDTYCCTSKFRELTKHSSFYTFEGCTNGNSFCGAYLHFFRNIDTYNEKNAILIRAEDNAVFNTNATLKLSSTIEYKNDTIIIHYIVDSGIPLTVNSTKLKHKTKKFDLLIIFSSDNLIIPDSTEFKEYIDVWW
jgi:hypothetical protein